MVHSRDAHAGSIQRKPSVQKLWHRSEPGDIVLRSYSLHRLRMTVDDGCQTQGFTRHLKLTVDPEMVAAECPGADNRDMDGDSGQTQAETGSSTASRQRA